MSEKYLETVTHEEITQNNRHDFIIQLFTFFFVNDIVEKAVTTHYNIERISLTVSVYCALVSIALMLPWFFLTRNKRARVKVGGAVLTLVIIFILAILVVKVMDLGST